MNVRVVIDQTEREACFRLRYEVLRKPWSQPAGSERDADDDAAVLIGAFDDKNQVIGTARLQYNNEQEAQLRYMAVDDHSRGSGAGRAMEQLACSLAAKNGCTRIVLHARENALRFYMSCGYENKGPSYVLFGAIQHYQMEKVL